LAHRPKKMHIAEYNRELFFFAIAVPNWQNWTYERTYEISLQDFLATDWEVTLNLPVTY